jgi:hypothetical protein
MLIDSKYHMDLFILFMLFSNVTLSVIRQLRIEKKLARIEDSINNNAYGKMYEILEEELFSVSTNSEHERAICNYYKHKLHDVQNAYSIIKIEGEEALAKESIFNIMEGSGKAELRSTCLNISEEDLNIIDELNRKHVYESKKQIYLLSDKSIPNIVKIMLKVFRQNIRATYQILHKYIQFTDSANTKSNQINITNILGNGNYAANGHSSITDQNENN